MNVEIGNTECLPLRPTDGACTVSELEIGVGPIVLPADSALMARLILVPFQGGGLHTPGSQTSAALRPSKKLHAEENQIISDCCESGKFHR